MRIGGVFLLCLIVSTQTVANPMVDPTRPMDFSGSGSRGGASAAPSGPALQSTLVSPERKSAIISGKRVKVGDTFEGAVVTEIRPYEVRLMRGGRETTLRMLPKLNNDKGAVE